VSFPPGCQRVNQVLDVCIELVDVTSNGENVGIQCTEFGVDVHDSCFGVNVSFLDGDLEKSHANWVLANVIILMVNHGLGFDFGHDGGGKTGVQHEVALGCTSLGVVVDGCMGPDLVHGDLSIMCDHGMG